MRKLFTFAIFLVLSGCISIVKAQTVEFSDLRLEHNVPAENGRQLLKFHYVLTVHGAVGHKVKVIMWVDVNEEGKTHHYSNGNNMCTEGNLLYCEWENTITKGDWWVGIYNDMLNPLPGKNKYFTRLGVWDETIGQYIGWSEFIAYEMTGAQPAQQPAPQYQQPASQSTPIPIKCSACRGTGVCGNCKGTRISPYNRAVEAACGACNGTGRCSVCNGTGISGYIY